MSPHVSPRSAANRRRRLRDSVVGIAVEGLYALVLFGCGYLICALATRV